MNDVAARTLPATSHRAAWRETHAFWAGSIAATTALAAVLGWLLERWPPHEDEALALFVGRSSIGELLHTVIAERGGAPLHFLLAWVVVQLDGGLGALRFLSLVFAVASVPLTALLGARLAGPRVGLVAAVLASGSWMFLFNGVYGRMYSLFLFTSLLAFLAMLSALERGGARRFALWGVALVLVLASHPYAVLVVAAQALFVVLRREHLKEATLTLAAVAVAATPFWWADLVLRDRFDVGVGGGGNRLGSPGAVLDYLRNTAADFSIGRHVWFIPVVLALAGALLLGRARARSLWLIACVVAVPAVAFTFATLGSSTSPETRHLIFALPFFSVLLAVPVVALASWRPPASVAAALLAVIALVAGGVRWAHERTPQLFDGDPAGETAARQHAAAWLATTARGDDVLLGYEPVFVRAWEQNRSFSANALPRADPVLLAAALRDVPEPLGRGVWVFDASDTTNLEERQTIPFVLPRPASAFEGRAYGPYLVIRSREPLETRTRYLEVSERVMRLGRTLQISDADVNLHALLVAHSRF